MDPRPSAGRPLGVREQVLVVLLVVAVVAAVVVRVRATGDDLVALPQADTVVRYEAHEGVVGEVSYLRDGEVVPAQDQQLHDALWDEWTAMIPPYWTRRVRVFEIASDGPGGFAAFVQQLDDEGDRWLLAVDPVDAADQPDRYHETLVHELAHLLTLGDGAVELRDGRGGTLDDLRSACGGPAVATGCARPGTVLHRFVETFWAAGADDGQLAGDVEAVAVAQYGAAPDTYVSAYAASGPSEDIAETFVALALSQAQPRGSVAEAKIALLRADPELFSVADRIRTTLRG